MQAAKKILLSHRLADKHIADVLKQSLEDWGFDNMIFQAPAPGPDGRSQERISDDLREALWEAKLVILLYTVADYDWSICMLECGLATHPKNLDTRTVVFQCNFEDSPRVLEEQLRVRVDKEGIRSFTAQLHRDPNFFPGEPAFRPGITEESLERLSSKLYQDLSSVIPPGRLEERYRWDFLTLQLSPSDARSIGEIERSLAVQEILERSLVIKDFGEALKHFGFANLVADLKLVDLVGRWKQKTQGRKGVEDNWVSGLAAEIHRAIDNSPANYEWSKLNSVYHPGSWFYPVVNHVRVMPDGRMEFQVYLYRSFRDNPAAL